MLKGSKWECDFCGCLKETEGRYIPKGWKEIILGVPYDVRGNTVTYANKWRGVLCYECSGFKHDENLSLDWAARPLLEKLCCKLFKKRRA